MLVRKETRFSGRCPVTFVLDDSACQGTTFNLSRSGCAIESEEMGTEGESVSLQIMVPGQATSIRVELGKVSWATRREFGVEFLVILDESKERLNHFLINVAKESAV